MRLPDVITLIVTPQDAITLNYLIYAGAELTLVLRSAGDEAIIDTQAVTLQYLLDQYDIPVPVKLPYGIEPRVDELVPPELPNDQPVPTPVQ
jgi:pilus assembly protein CpaB